MQVGVGEDAALGAAGGAGGVADGRHRVGGEGAAALGDLLVADVPSEGGEVGEGRGVEFEDARALGVGGGARVDGGGVGGGLGDHVPGAGVADDPLDLVGGGGGVDGDRPAAGRPDREVQDGPLVAGAGHDGDPSAGLQAGRDQALGHGGHLAGELRRGDGPPGAVHLAAQEHRVGRLGRVGERDVGDAARGGAGREGGGAGLADGSRGVPDGLGTGAGHQVTASSRPFQVLAYAHDGSRSLIGWRCVVRAHTAYS